MKNPWVLKAKFTKLGKMLTDEFLGIRMKTVGKLLYSIQQRSKELKKSIGLKGDIILKIQIDGAIFEKVTVRPKS